MLLERESSEASAIASAAGLAILRRFGRGMPCSIQRVDLVEELVDEDVGDSTFFSTRPCA